MKSDQLILRSRRYGREVCISPEEFVNVAGGWLSAIAVVLCVSLVLRFLG